ncbi:unnamed protein product [Sympodiomycopsis kandeliae]
MQSNTCLYLTRFTHEPVEISFWKSHFTSLCNFSRVTMACIGRLRGANQVELRALANNLNHVEIRTVSPRLREHDISRRAYSSSPFSDSSIAQTVSQQLGLPRFRARSKDIALLKTPSSFYEEIKGIIKRAQHRIYLSSLYIGKDEVELLQCLRESLQSKPGLRVIVLLDALRSTREGPFTYSPSSDKKLNPSCASLIASLARDFPNQIDVRLYRTPGLSPWMEKIIGKRLVEGAGLQHMKIYGGDDEVIISGANLSTDYFTNRQDRYVHLKKNKMLSIYLHSLMLVTARFSYGLHSDSIGCGDGTSRHPHHSSYRIEWDQGKRLLLAETCDGSISEDGSLGDTHSDHREYHFESSAGNAIQSHTHRWKTNTSSDQERDPANSGCDTTIVPLIQMGPLNIQQETQSMPIFFSQLSSPSQVDMTSGYFSLFPAYKSLLLSLPSDIHTNIIAAAPISNGFYGSKGISRHIPPAYTWLESKFWKEIKRRSKQDDIQITEWEKEGWTYHAKGVWYTPPSSETPTHTLLGSSNFGSRSALRDLECTLLIETDAGSSLSKDLQVELDNLHQHATVKVDDELFNRQERQVSWGVKVATEIIKGRL